jgi:hypothetical protein
VLLLLGLLAWSPLSRILRHSNYTLAGLAADVVLGLAPRLADGRLLSVTFVYFRLLHARGTSGTDAVLGLAPTVGYFQLLSVTFGWVGYFRLLPGLAPRLADGRGAWRRMA